MQWDQDQPPDHTKYAPTADSADGMVNVTRAISPKNTQGVTATVLVNQLAGMIESIKDRAAENEARAYDIAQRVVGALDAANSRIRSLELAQSAAETSLSEANARVEKAEQTAEALVSQIAAIEDRLTTAENRARNAEARAIDAEKALILVEDGIRRLMLEKRQPPMGASAVGHDCADGGGEPIRWRSVS